MPRPDEHDVRAKARQCCINLGLPPEAEDVLVEAFEPLVVCPPIGSKVTLPNRERALFRDREPVGEVTDVLVRIAVKRRDGTVGYFTPDEVSLLDE